MVLNRIRAGIVLISLSGLGALEVEGEVFIEAVFVGLVLNS